VEQQVLFTFGMKPAVLLLLAFAVLGQDTPAKNFTGTWEARFNGAVFCVLKIQPGDKLTGTMTSVDIGVDNEGNLTTAEGKDEAFPILKPAIENDSLTFEWTDDPNEDPLKFEMKLTGKQEAQLRFVTTPEGVKVKPFTFAKRSS
jgi:hypothetical protein